MRLRRSDCAGEGFTRRRAGKGFVYLDESGEMIRDEELLERIRSLAIPPAWEDVWICPSGKGHIQATGIDDAGRKQYLYHEHWTARRAAEKFDSMVAFAAKLPALRRRVGRDIAGGDVGRDAVLACAVRLMDLGHFRIGGEQYAEENETFGVATILRDQVALPRGTQTVEFSYPAKGSLDRRVLLRDPEIRAVSEKLKRRRAGPDDFLAYRSGRRWVDLKSHEINEYIQETVGEGHSAKDFRTWNGTVYAATYLATAGPPPSSSSAREKVIREAVRAVAEELGNTPAVARSSYIDPRLFDRYRDGKSVDAGKRPGRPARRGLSRAERAVLDLLD